MRMHSSDLFRQGDQDLLDIDHVYLEMVLLCFICLYYLDMVYVKYM